MAKAKEAKEKKEKVRLADKDHPSLCEISGNIRLRVLEDFNIEMELPKWKKFQEEWDKIRKELGIYDSTTEEELKNKVSHLKDKTDDEKAAILKQAKNLIAMSKAVRDDQWNIRKKHEREVDQAILKQARFVRELSWADKIKNRLKGRKVVPVNIAMDELLEHVELTSTPELEGRLIKVREIEDGMRKAGQYAKADAVRALRSILVEEAVVCAAGFQSYITEDTMIEFLRKSERGTEVNFLRYYEDEIPPDVIEKKLAADKLMVFDNYVVAYYSDLIAKAAKVEKKTKDAEEKKTREKRRDPILFGVIKNSRKLYYICDWVTDTDDLTLEKLEKELGITRNSLVSGASTGTADTTVVTSGGTLSTEARSQITRLVQNEIMNYDEEVRGGWSSYTSTPSMICSTRA